MPSGIVKYQGSRGIVWRIRYEDASGRQCQRDARQGVRGLVEAQG
jgi:hypothetical protein